ncbi:hypothetical protein [Arthrobacter sp. 179]|uniref:hypothetical protein n=1 Tax=Arthrobacter sp. 179 TaxID=3457734 RepID=UPI0040332F43
MGRQQLLTLTDVAHLAQVRRPVVSMWRKRTSPTGRAFPAAATMRGAQELFDADDIARWLTETGRGNNPDAALDVAVHAISTIDDPLAVTALVTLQGRTGQALSMLDEEDIVDAADEMDPDDTYLYSEIEALGDKLRGCSELAGELVDAAFSPEAAMEAIVQEMPGRFLGLSQTRLAPEVVALAAGTAVELARRLGEGREVVPTFLDASVGGSDIPLAILRELGESLPGRFGLVSSSATLEGTGAALTRLAERRLKVHLRSDGNHGPADPGLTGGPIVHVAQFPAPGFPSPTATEVLTSLEDFVQHLGTWDSAVILAPAEALTDELRGVGEGARSRILRTGRIRASVRLPEKLLPASPRRAMALWVLGPAHANVPIADRWTMIADLSAANLDTAARQDLISDLSASLGTRREISAHAFRFARLVPTPTLLASWSASPLSSTPPTAPSPAGAEPSAVDHLVRLESAMDAIESTPVPTGRLGITFDVPPKEGQRAPAQHKARTQQSLGTLLAKNQLRYLPGTRIEPEILGSEGFPVWDVDRLEPGISHPKDHHINVMVLAAEHPRATLTEPGDIIFRTGPRPRAVIDRAGSAVVRYPARILRVNAGQSTLVPDVIAADINAAPGGLWRQWPVRSLTPEAASGLGAVLARVEATRDELLEGLQRVDDLTALLLDGAAAGVIATLDEELPTMEGRP